MYTQLTAIKFIFVRYYCSQFFDGTIISKGQNSNSVYVLPGKLTIKPGFYISIRVLNALFEIEFTEKLILKPIQKPVPRGVNKKKMFLDVLHVFRVQK